MDKDIPWRRPATALQEQMKAQANNMLRLANQSGDAQLQAAAERVLDQVTKLYSAIQVAGSKAAQRAGY